MTDSEDMTDGESVHQYMPSFFRHTPTADCDARNQTSQPDPVKKSGSHPSVDRTKTVEGQDKSSQGKKGRRLYEFNLPSSGRLRTRNVDVSSKGRRVIIFLFLFLRL